jgi:TctA family transporter
MLKFIVLLFVAVWALSLFLAPRRRLIRDADHLIRLLVWVFAAFLGVAGIQQWDKVQELFWLKALTAGLWFAVSWVLSGWLVRMWKRD